MAVLTLTVLASLLADLAQAILGAIVLVAAIGLVNLAPLRRIRTIRRRDFSLGLVALAGVLTFGVLGGVLVAVLISLLTLAHEVNHPRIVTSRPAPGLLVVRPEGRLYFANGRRVCEEILSTAVGMDLTPSVVIVDAGAIPDLEITALERLADLAEELQGRGMVLWVTELNQRPYEMLRRGAELLGRTSLESGSGPLGVRFFANLDQAVAAYERRAEPDRPPV
jgi:sulfate permease, SulP family